MIRPGVTVQRALTSLTPADRIRRATGRIAVLWPTTEQPPRTTTSSTRIVYGPRLPGAGDVLAARQTCSRDVLAIARFAVDELDLHPHLSGTDVPGLADLLGTHADALAILDRDARRQLEHHARVLEEIVTQSQPARIRVADCPRCDTGRLIAVIRAHDPDQLGDVIACDARDQVVVTEPTDEQQEQGVAAGDKVLACGAAWTSFEWRACWREVRRVHGVTGRRAARPTRWHAYDPHGVARLAEALGIPVRPRPAPGDAA